MITDVFTPQEAPLITALRVTTVTAVSVATTTVSLYFVGLAYGWSNNLERGVVTAAELSILAAGISACVSLIVRHIADVKGTVEVHMVAIGPEHREEADRIVRDIRASIRAEIADLSQSIEQYGDERETAGFVRGMRSAAVGKAPVNGNVVRMPNRN